ncbi:hypothetical protein FCIRC_9938 [Fusarium circinatum]|uniref:Uncharacterized protein n=1 Tax=Fusarium circinatum TaxID=48490 RepID=A0A8H5TD45_FUSCI|nr:hypothetical protein FCIRC_9938 [Fusarium circinatum]
MSNQRSPDEEARMIAKIYSTAFYKKVSDLARNTGGTVYDPSMAPPPSPLLKEFCPIPPSSQAPRPETPGPKQTYIDNSLIPGKTIVNDNWEENLKRIFGETYGGKDWKDLGDMTYKCWMHLRKERNRNRRSERWNMDEIERYGRLSVWGVHDDVIAALIGWPVGVIWTPEEQAHFEAALVDEWKYIHVTPQEAQENVVEREKELSPEQMSSPTIDEHLGVHASRIYTILTRLIRHLGAVTNTPRSLSLSAITLLPIPKVAEPSYPVYSLRWMRFLRHPQRP